jgi:hypothetical protein
MEHHSESEPEHDPPNVIDELYAGVVPSKGNIWILGTQFQAPGCRCDATLALHTRLGN